MEKTCIHKIVFKKGSSFHKRLPNKKTYRFKTGVNILCGPNGSGKSSVLEGIISFSKKGRKGKEPTHIELEADSGQMRMFDYEKNNPRMKSYFDSDIRFQMAAMIHSHGETNREINKFLVEESAKDSLLLLDEPEQALDIEGIMILKGLLENTVANQVIVATHEPLLICNSKFNAIELQKGYREKVKELYFNNNY